MKKLLFLPFFACTVLINCSNNKSNNVTPNTDYFPNAIGNIYTYAVTDSLNNKIFNVNVAIIGQTTLLGKPVKIWAYNGPNYVDTNYVFSNKDSVIFYSIRKTDITNLYHLPFVVGARWGNPYSDTTRVMSVQPLVVKAGAFSQAFFLKEHAHSPNYDLIKNQWVVPNVGIVKMNIIERNLGPSTLQFWELISYKIK